LEAPLPKVDPKAKLGAKALLLHQVFSAFPKFLFKDCFVNFVDKTIP
jgi:hypothetical protein